MKGQVCWFDKLWNLCSLQRQVWTSLMWWQWGLRHAELSQGCRRAGTCPQGRSARARSAALHSFKKIRSNCEQSSRNTSSTTTAVGRAKSTCPPSEQALRMHAFTTVVFPVPGLPKPLPACCVPTPSRAPRPRPASQRSGWPPQWRRQGARSRPPRSGAAPVPSSAPGRPHRNRRRTSSSSFSRTPRVRTSSRRCIQHPHKLTRPPFQNSFKRLRRTFRGSCLLQGRMDRQSMARFFVAGIRLEALTPLRLSFLLDKRMSKQLGICFHLCLLGLAVAVPPAAVVPGEQLAAQVRGLERMMQQMTLQQQAFMQTKTASFQQQQQSLMQSMEASMQQQQQLLRQQFGNVAPVPPETLGPPGLANYRISAPSPARSPPPPPPRDPSDGERDVFAKSDKWLPSLPTIDFALWKDRISEALGFLTWMEKLTSWVGLGSEVFPNELRHAVRTRDEAVLGQDRLTVEQQKRSIRLLHILRQTFAGHDKSSLILQNYVEGEQS